MVDVSRCLQRANDKVQLVDVLDHLIWQIGLVCQQMFEGCGTFLIENSSHHHS